MLTRIITGIVGIVVAAFVIQAGGAYFAAVALVLSLVAFFEFVHAFDGRGGDLPLVTGAIGLILIWGCAWLGNSDEMLAVSMGIVLVILLETVFLYGRVRFSDACLSIAGVFYFGLPFAHVILLRFLNPDMSLDTPLGPFAFGCAMIWILFIGTWASDTFAYFTGSAIGSHKLAPAISPNKTIEGFLGSVVGTTATLAGLGVFFGLPLAEMAGLGFAISIIATLGDLVESIAKRETRIKDSGHIIPGHGGVWDRFDSVLYTAPVVYYFVVLSNLAAK